MDFNFRVHPVPARIAIALDQSDIYIAFTNALAKVPFISAHGGMEFKAASRGKKSTGIVVQAVLLRTVRGACEGRDFQGSNQASTSSPNLTDATFRREVDSVAGFFSEIALRMGERWSKFDSLHLTAPGWQALGVVHHDIHHRGLTSSSNEKTRICDVIAGLDWSRQNREWVDEGGLGQWTVPKAGMRSRSRSSARDGTTRKRSWISCASARGFNRSSTRPPSLWLRERLSRIPIRCAVES